MICLYVTHSNLFFLLKMFKTIFIEIHEREKTKSKYLKNNLMLQGIAKMANNYKNDDTFCIATC